MRRYCIAIAIGCMSSVALAWQIPNDITSIANPKHATQKNPSPEKPPSGMTVYRAAPGNPPPQNASTHTYKWLDPRSKREMTSAVPPGMPYRMLTKENGIAWVEVTPPGTGFAKGGAMPSGPTGPPSATKPLPPESTTEQACSKLGPFATTIAELRERGVSLALAETSASVSLSKYTNADGIEFAKQVVRSIYANKLTPQNAAANVIASCKVLVFMGELEQKRKAQ